jgi:GGDEF domain-containing protein
MGQRLSGWVAANRQTILNSDPMLDLGEVARALKPALRSCLSAVLSADSELVGVLTVYSTHRNAFDEDHRRIVEVICRQVSQTIKQAVGQEHRIAIEPSRDETAGLPNRHQLERFLSSELSLSSAFPCSIVLLEFRVNGRQLVGPAELSTALGKATDAIRPVLRPTDSVFHYDSHRLIISLPQTDSTTADVVVGSIHSVLRMAGQSGAVPLLSLSFIGCATAPSDGVALSNLLATAEKRPFPIATDSRPSIH